MGSVGYEREFFAPLSAIEDRHFWFRSRNRIIAAVLEPLVRGLPSGYRILEVGCGTGNVLGTLASIADRGHVVGMDLFAEGLRLAGRRTTSPVVQGRLESAPFKARFDIVGAFDVIEHLADDVDVLRCLHRLMRPEGRLLVTVPAHASLWSYFDEVSHHQRRYGVKQLVDTFAAARFEIEYCSQFMTILYPLVWARRQLMAVARPNPGDDRERVRAELKIIPGLNGLLALLLAQEARWIARGKRLPIGTSLIALGRKLP